MNRVEGLCESVTFQLEKVTQCKGRKNFSDEGEKRNERSKMSVKFQRTNR
jgi:hypothetical protein